MAEFVPWTSPNGQRWTIAPDAVPMVEPFFKRLHELHPEYQSLGGYANRPMRTLDGRNLGGVSTHASGYTLDVKAPDSVLRQLASEFPDARWGGNFKSHYDPVHFEFARPQPAQSQQTAQASPAPASQPAPQETARMADETREPSFLDQLAGRFSNPLTQGGLGLLLAASQGGDMAAGLRGGVQTGLAAQKQQRDAVRMMQQKMLLQKMAQDPNFARQAGLPPGLMDLAVAGEDPGMVAQFISKRPDRELDQRKLQLGVDQLAEQVSQNRVMNPIHQRQAESQASLTDLQAQAARRDLDTPPQQITVLPPDAKAILSNRRTGQHQVIDNGNQKLSDAERSAILESDNQIQTGQSALSTIRQIRALNQTAYDSWFAEGRADMASPFGAQNAQDTQVMKNLITSQALDQLRATFGGNPTEGERKILLDIQGALNQPRAVRERLFSRAEDLVAQRLRTQEQRANGLRGGSYFKSGYHSQQQPAGVLEQPQSPKSGAAPSVQPRQIQNDADYDTIKPGEKYIDPNGVARIKGGR